MPQAIHKSVLLINAAVGRNSLARSRTRLIIRYREVNDHSVAL